MMMSLAEFLGGRMSSWELLVAASVDNLLLG